MSVSINIDAVVVGVEGHMADIEVILDVVMVFLAMVFIFAIRWRSTNAFLPSQRGVVTVRFRCVVAVDFSFGQMGKRDKGTNPKTGMIHETIARHRCSEAFCAPKMIVKS